MGISKLRDDGLGENPTREALVARLRETADGYGFAGLRGDQNALDTANLLTLAADRIEGDDAASAGGGTSARPESARAEGAATEGFESIPALGAG